MLRNTEKEIAQTSETSKHVCYKRKKGIQNSRYSTRQHQPLIASTYSTGAKVSDHDETRTRNLLIRSQTPYPLGHAVMAIHILKIKLKRPIAKMIISLPAFLSIFPQKVDGKTNTNPTDSKIAWSFDGNT